MNEENSRDIGQQETVSICRTVLLLCTNQTFCTVGPDSKDNIRDGDLLENWNLVKDDMCCGSVGLCTITAVGAAMACISVKTWTRLLHSLSMR